MNNQSILTRLNKVYNKQGCIIKTGLYPWHFSSKVATSLPFSSVFKDNVKLSVGGGIAFTEMFFFAELCSQCKLRNILVIGNSFGLSSVLLSLLNPNAKVVAIDAGVEGLDNDEGTILTRRIASQENLNLVVVKGFSPLDVPNVVDQHLHGTIDLVFIDGLHTNKQQIKDFNACWAYGGSDCIYVFHDVLNYKMTASFKSICDQHKDMRGDILWKTPSGMGVVSNPLVHSSIMDTIDLFTETPDMIEFTKIEVKVEKYLFVPILRSIPRFLPKSVVRSLRNLIFPHVKRRA